MYDAIVVGGGPAGLSAALVLSRCRRRVLVIDEGRPRNAAARGVHNFMTRDGMAPSRLRALARAEAAKYGAAFRRGRATAAWRCSGGFAVRTDGTIVRGRTLLLATGVRDDLPSIPGLLRFYGVGVHHCPYCDAWPYRDRVIAAFGPGRHGLGLAKSLLTWSRRVVVLTNGKRLGSSASAEARALGILVRTEAIAELTGGRRLRGVTFTSGQPERVDALFFNTEKTQRSTLPVRLGCAMSEDGGVIHDRRQRTGIPGLYLAGDASFDVQFVIVAAAEGAKAAVAMNRQMQDWDRAAEAKSQADVARFRSSSPGLQRLTGPREAFDGGVSRGARTHNSTMEVLVNRSSSQRSKGRSSNSGTPGRSNGSRSGSSRGSSSRRGTPGRNSRQSGSSSSSSRSSSRRSSSSRSTSGSSGGNRGSSRGRR